MTKSDHKFALSSLRFLASASLLAMMAPAVAAHAETAAPETKAAETTAPDGEITVTARRSTERLQDVPVAVAAFGAEALTERRISTELDLQFATPGLTVRSAVSSNQINYAIRGQSIDGFSFSSPAVTAYLNEVPTGGTSGTALFDLESLQVLKGPQGTLFGRNATGGAVLYASQKPTNEFGGYLKGGYGNFNNVEVEGAINVPLGSGIALRLSGRSQTRDGFQTNLIDGNRVNSIDAQVGRASLLVAPEGSRFSNLTVVQRGHYGGNNGSLSIQNANGVNGAPSTYVDPADGLTKPLVTVMRDFHAADALGAGKGSSTDPRVNALYNGITDYLTKRAAGQAGGFYDVSINRDQKHRANQMFVSNTTSFDVSDDITLKNIFGYNKVMSEDFIDVDGSPYEFFGANGGPAQTKWGENFSGNGYIFGTRQWSDELQLSGKVGKLKFIAGGFISREETLSYIPVTIVPDLGAPYLGSYDSTSDDRSRALYAQLTYAVTDRLNLTGGLRYTWESYRIKFAPSTAGDPKLLGAVAPGRLDDSKPSWLVGLDFKVTDDLLLYFNHRGSWRTGGFNGASGARFPNADSFKPETTYDFELGAKFSGNLGPVRTRLNIAVYDQYIKNVQRTIYLNNAANAGNVNKARVSGVEIDGNFILSKWLEVGGAYTHTNGRYTDNRATLGVTSYLFAPYADAPKNTGSFYARASTDLGDLGNVALRGELYAQSHFYYSNLDATVLPGTRIDGYHLVNLRAEWNEIRSSKVNAALYVNNLTKSKYYTGGIALGQVTGTNATIPGAPRMYGFELSVKF
ncbi:TonB-dependent receptor [Novosphingobium sp.]|uniref:TonB-dependent receptor n=1 Tax=Novosphingobium sp. TaxID=1874826 RepID=UPI003BAA8107